MVKLLQLKYLKILFFLPNYPKGGKWLVLNGYFFDLVFADIGFLSEYSCDRFVVKP